MSKKKVRKMEYELLNTFTVGIDGHPYIVANIVCDLIRQLERELKAAKAKLKKAK